MKKICTIALILFAAIVVSCGGSAVDGAMNKVEKALDRVEKNKASMTQDDWKALETELEEPLQTLAAALENDQVGVLKRVELTMLTARVATVFMEAGVNTVLKEMENSGVTVNDLQQAAEQLEAVGDSLNADAAAEPSIPAE